MTATLKVLMVEDSPEDAHLILRQFEKGGYSVIWERVFKAEALAAALAQGRWDVVLSDFTIPGFSGAAALTQVRQYSADLPFIFVSGTIGEDAAVAAMRSGADDYILKDSLTRLVAAVERSLREVSVRRERRLAEERVAHFAYHDALTDLPNRLLFQDRLEQAVLAAHRTGDPVALLVMDLDGFKAINDSLGHYAGDRVLTSVASLLLGALREADTIARLGGDEFAFVLPRTDGRGGTIAARKVLNALKRPVAVDGHSLTVRGSIGIACYPEHGTTAELLLQKADIAMYAAKSGKLECTIYSKNRDRDAHSRLAAIQELQDGIAQAQFTFEYQPLIHLETGEVSAIEALARWAHPSRGTLHPESFIGLAEETGLINSLTMLLLDKALRDWVTSFSPAGIPIAVNLSARNLLDAELPDKIATALKKHSVPANMLQFEITENFLVSEPTRAARYLARLHDMGATLALDDFGSGYSSLSYLRQLPVDVLKIDRSFISGAASMPDAIVKCAIDLAHNLGLAAVAEGVESADALQRLRQLGCDIAQGFFLAPPRPAPETLSWIQQHACDRRKVITQLR